MAFNEILEWSEKQEEPWKQDALHRLAVAAGRAPSDQDCAETLVRVKHANGILADPAPDCTPLTADDFPKDIASTERVLLASIGPVQHVDRLAKDQKISFAVDGLTLIYGDNGSGKTGYSRITKKLCRSLTIDPLRGDVFKESANKPAEVLIRFKTDLQLLATEECWIDGSTPPAAIANISVFDSKNARLYVDRDNKIQYLPPEIELMEHYSSLLQKVAQQVETEAAEIRKRTAIALPTGFTPDSAISVLIAPMNSVAPPRKGARQAENTAPLPKLDALTSAAAWNDTLAAELKGLEESLRDDPAAQAAKCQRAAAVLISFSEELKLVESHLSVVKATELEGKFDKAQAAKVAAAVAASETFKDEPLPQTGSDAWKLMYHYAKEYAQLAAGEPTEQISARGLCVTCQQVISPEAAERLKRFEDFISAKANTEAEAAVAELTTLEEALKALKISTKADAERLLAEYGGLSDVRKAFAEKIVVYIEAAGKRRGSLQAAIKDGDFSKIEPTSATPSVEIDAEAIALKDEGTILSKKATEAGGRADDVKRLANLKDQKKLSEAIETFTARLTDLQLLEKLKGCTTSLSIAGVSPLITRLRKKLVTDDLQSRVAAEIAAFDLSHIPFSVKDSIDGGKSMVGIKLKAVADVHNRDVLSEGEQRALALACFLGEVAGDPVKHGIIIDDPVSSLDHIRIRRVAERLVREASEGRQVIIFTHNVLFYSEVIFAAGQLSPQVPIKKHCIRQDKTMGFGIVHEDDEPWIAKDVGKRVHILRSNRLPALKDRTDADTDAYRREVKDFYTDLRETWERFVEEVLLGGVVERFNNEVKTQSLKRVIVENDDYQKIFYAMKRVSERSGHDTAAAKTISTPSHDDMKKDLDELDDFRKAVKARGDKLQDERKKLEKPPAAQVA